MSDCRGRGPLFCLLSLVLVTMGDQSTNGGSILLEGEACMYEMYISAWLIRLY